MAEDKRIIYLEINASKAVEGSSAATRALEKLERGTASMDGALSRMEKGLASVGGMVKAQLALMVAELGARFIQMGKDAFNAAAGLGELAEQLGVSARFLQAMQLSAVQSGVKLEQLETSFSKFSQKMGEAADGSKEMVEALTALGVKNLDVQGKLRPTESLMVDVASAITSIEDPARRASTAVDFFGKAGTRMLPMLADIAKGADSVTAATERMGAMIPDSTIARLDKFGDRLAVGARVHLATFAEGIVSVIDQLDKLDAWLQGGANGINEWLRGAIESMGDWVDATLGFLDAVVIAGARFNAGFAESIRSIPEQLGRVFVDGMNQALIALESGLNKITSTIADKAPWLGIGGGGISLGRIDGGGASAGSRNAGIASAEDAAEAQLRANGYGRDYATERARQRTIDRQAGFASDEDAARIGRLGPLGAPGAATSAIKGAGQGEGDKYAKLIAQLTLAADAQDKMTAAARSGEVAFQDQEIKLKAAEKALGIYGQALDATDPRLQKIEELIRRDTMGKAAQSYVTATTEIEKQNEVLEAEIRLINATIPARAAEIALIKAKQDADKAGQALTPQDKEGRRVAIEQNEQLKAQGEEIRKANELWTAPLKTALSSIQTTAADAFEGMLNSGKINFQSLGDVFKKTVTRMIAEFMALQFVRPVMSVVVQAMSGAGILSGSTASSLGFGGGSGGSSSAFGGGGGFSMPSFGDGGGLTGSLGSWEAPSWLGGGTPFSGVSNFFGQTLYGGSNAAVGAMSMADPMAQGAMQASSLSGAGVSLGSALGAAAGIGMGAYSLFTAKNTAQTIGGIGQMIGGGMMLIPGMQIPGMIVSVLSSVLPSLLGGEEYKWDPLAGANVQFGMSGGKYTGTGTEQLGGRSIAGQFAGVGTTMDALFKSVGGVKDPGAVFGSAVWNNQREGTTSTYLISPTQGSNQLSEAGGDPAAAVEAMIVRAFTNSVRGGAANKVSDTLMTALNAKQEMKTLKELDSVLSLSKAYDDLGKTTSAVEQALDGVNSQFQPLVDFANEVGLSLEKIDAEKARASAKVYIDFINQFDTTSSAAAQVSEQFKAINAAFEAFTKRAADLGKTVNEIAADKAQVFGRMNYDSLEASRAAVDEVNDPMRASLVGLRREHDSRVNAAAALGTGTGAFTELVTAAANVYQVKLAATVGGFIKGLADQLTALENPMKVQLAAMAEQHAANVKAAEAIKLVAGDTTALTTANVLWRAQITKIAETLNVDVAQSLLEMADPLQAQITALHKSRDAALLSADAVNEYASAMGTTLVDTLKMTELYAKREAAIKEQYYAQSLSGLEALIKRLTFGDLAGASPTSMLAGTRGDYRATLSAAQSGDIKGLENLSGAADTYVQSARSYFASSPEYYAIVKEVKDAITAIDVNIRAGNITTGSAPGGNAIDAGAWAGIVTSLQEMVSTQNQQIAVLRDELGTTNALLRRQLLNA